MPEGLFTSDLFRFLQDLRRHNDRAWFAKNKERYLDVVQEPAQEFVRGFGPYLRKISPHFVADDRPVGGSLFRIYRDVRFAKDKRPLQDPRRGRLPAPGRPRRPRPELLPPPPAR
jgi:uncharacterized protein (TIGR02453 family)